MSLQVAATLQSFVDNDTGLQLAASGLILVRPDWMGFAVQAERTRADASHGVSIRSFSQRIRKSSSVMTLASA